MTKKKKNKASKKTNKRSTKTRKGATKVISQITAKPTESDLEAEIHLALRLVFPWIPASDLKHQTKFSFNVGRTVYDVDGYQAYRAEGRADVIIEVKGKPLAVLELKRRGVPLTPQDADQGLSYARMLTPMPPLVLVTNGADVRLLETHTGNDWKPANELEKEFAKLVDAASRAAGVDVKRAVEVLLGTDAHLWVTALRQATSIRLDELSGAWGNPLVPFVRNFLIPREATKTVLAQLRRGTRAVIVEGPPLAGKSSVLRELAIKTETSADLAVLFLEADGYGPGIFQQLANLLGSTLAWPVSSDEVRAWLRRLSKAEGPALVLAIDGPPPDNADIRKDIDELCSAAYGKNIRLVLALDDTVVQAYTLNASARKETALGRAAVKVEVTPLRDVEFVSTLKLLWTHHRVGFMEGAMAAAELRTPWVLRALAANIVEDPTHQATKGVAMLPPLLGLNLIARARQRFKDPELRRKLRQVAKAVLQDSGDPQRPHGLILEAIGLFMVRSQTLEDFLNHSDLQSLVSQGVLKRGIHASGEAVLFARLPELLASELSQLVAEELGKRIAKDAEEAAEWLAETANGLPLGDLVGAQAIFDTVGDGAITLDFLNALLAVPPREEEIRPGANFALHIPGFGLARLEFQEDGSLVWSAHGEREVIQPTEGDDFGSLIADHSSWLILSHFASVPFSIQTKDGNAERLDAPLLLMLGTCPNLLRGPQNDPERDAVWVHSVPDHGTIVCHKSGIIEPVTLAIARLLREDEPGPTDWLQKAVELHSFALLMRTYIALQQLASASTPKGAWAKKMLKEVVEPALNSFPSLH